LCANKYEPSEVYLFTTVTREESTDEQDADIQLFSSRDRVMAIDSQVKKRILELLQSGIIPLMRSSCSGKSKSTISVHVHDLIKAGLISSHTDPDDSRKKILSLASNPIGRLTNIDRHASARRI
jgi:predicted transcriptional regulator